MYAVFHCVCVCCVCVHVWPFTVIQSQKNKLKWAIIECIHFCARAVWTNGNVNSVLKPMRDAHHIRCLQSKLGQQQYFVQCESCLLIIWPRWQTPLTTTKTRYEHLHFVLCTFNLVPRCEDYASEKKKIKIHQQIATMNGMITYVVNKKKIRAYKHKHWCSIPSLDAQIAWADLNVVVQPFCKHCNTFNGGIFRWNFFRRVTGESYISPLMSDAVQIYITCDAVCIHCTCLYSIQMTFANIAEIDDRMTIFLVR